MPIASSPFLSCRSNVRAGVPVSDKYAQTLSLHRSNRHLGGVHGPSPHPAHRLGFAEFVALMAALMAIAALSIDSMLPALPAIGRSLSVADANDRQWIISSFMLGFGGAQLIYGPLSDRFGRRPVLLASLAAAIACNLLAAAAPSFAMLIVARVAAGVATAAGRVLSVSIVRDRVAGDEMARVMSLIAIVFMIVPIAAPSIGQLILLVAPWRWIFGVIAGAGVLLLIWSAWRLPETLDPANMRRLDARDIAAGFRSVLTQRISLGYTLGSTLMQGALFGFILSVQQVFEQEFRAPQLFPALFAVMAGTMAAASFLNSRLVMRVGARAVSHRAMIGFVVFAALHLFVAAMGWETIASFTILQALAMSCFSLAAANMNSVAMEPMGEMAGTASSIQGFIQTVGGVTIGAVIGQSFDGTTVPLYAGFTLCGLAALAVVAFAERGRMFGR